MEVAFAAPGGQDGEDASGGESDRERNGEAHVENVGLGGARLAMDRRIRAEVGDTVCLSLVAPSLWDPLVLRGRVVWVDGHGDGRDDRRGGTRAAEAGRRLGVAFVHEKARAVLALHDLISTLAYE